MFHQRGDLPTTVKLQRTLQCDQISLLEYLFRKMNKVSINQITCLTLFLLSLHKFCFFVSVTLISFILKCYPLFCINFFYVKVVFHQIHVNLSRVNLQLFFSIRIYIGWNLQNFKNILRINPKLRYWKGYIFVCSKAVNTIQLYVFNLFHSLKPNWLGNKTKKPALIIIV